MYCNILLYVNININLPDKFLKQNNHTESNQRFLLTIKLQQNSKYLGFSLSNLENSFFATLRILTQDFKLLQMAYFWSPNMQKFVNIQQYALKVISDIKLCTKYVQKGILFFNILEHHISKCHA